MDVQPSGRMQTTSIAADAALQPRPLSIRARDSGQMPLPSPENDYLGFCKSAWRIQTGDRSALKKSKESSLGSETIYRLVCTASKCDFATQIEVSLIGTWESVVRTYEHRGVVFRFPFLAKSHVRQTKVKPGQIMYKCLFCAFAGLHAPIIQGTGTYIEHVAQKHRGSDFSQVMLHRTGCVNDRICKDGR